MTQQPRAATSRTLLHYFISRSFHLSTPSAPQDCPTVPPQLPPHPRFHGHPRPSSLAKARPLHLPWERPCPCPCPFALAFAFPCLPLPCHRFAFALAFLWTISKRNCHSERSERTCCLPFLPLPFFPSLPRRICCVLAIPSRSTLRPHPLPPNLRCYHQTRCRSSSPRA